MQKDETWSWPGARWWRCDFHLHTPASHDAYNGQDVSAEDWVEAPRAAGLDAVAITDHNTGEWVDRVAAAARKLDGPTVFPGVELTVEPGVHLLALFEPDSGGDAVKALLGKVDLSVGEWGKPKALARISISAALALVDEAGGLVIAAHVEDPKGLLRVLGSGQSLQKILTDPRLAAVEVGSRGSEPDPEKDRLLALLDGSKEGYRRPAGPLSQLTFSDAHDLAAIGRRSTWIKMTRPTLEGLRLALRDGELSVEQAAGIEADPNHHGAAMIEELEITGALYHGRFRDREGHPQPFRLQLNPWLNAIIGGRGTGKSSLVEFLRVVLRRDGDVLPALQPDFESFRRIPDVRNAQGVLTEETRLSVIYRKDGTRFRIQWSPAGDLEPIAEWREGEWHRGEGEVAQRFPVRITSQKQIFELARNPIALLEIVDDAAAIDRRRWDDRRRELENRFVTLGAKVRELDDELDQEPRLKGELDDVVRRLNVLEQSGEAQVLREVGQRRRQRHLLDTWCRELFDNPRRVREISEELVPATVDPGQFGTGAEDQAILGVVETIGRRIDGARQRLEELATELADIAEAAGQQMESSAWQSAHDRVEQQYQEMAESEEIREQYSQLMQERRLLENRLRSFEARRNERQGLGREAGELLQEILQHRLELTRRRKEFLASTLDGNPHVRIEVVPFGARETVEAELRDILRLAGTSYARDLGSVDDGESRLGRLYHDLPPESPESNPGEELAKRLKRLKQGLAKLIKGDATSSTAPRFGIRALPTSSRAWGQTIFRGSGCGFPRIGCVSNTVPMAGNSVPSTRVPRVRRPLLSWPSCCRMGKSP